MMSSNHADLSGAGRDPCNPRIDQLGGRKGIAWIPTYSLSLVLLVAGCQPSENRPEKPIRLVITGDTKGTIGECSCPHGQPAGLARRKAIFGRIRETTPDAIFVDCGDLTDRDMREAELCLLVELYKLLDYDAIGCYIEDLERIGQLAGRDPKIRIPLLMGNVSQTGEDSSRSDFKITDLTKPVILPQPWKKTIWIDVFTSLYNVAETENPPDLNEYYLQNWKHYSNALRASNYLASGLSVMICNWDYTDPDMATVPSDLRSDMPGLDVLIVGGSGNIEPEVVNRDGLLVVYPGVYGEFVMVLDLWSKNGIDVDRFEWETIATETVAPDSIFVAMINDTLKS